jgi:hypothetical protein
VKLLRYKSSGDNKNKVKTNAQTQEMYAFILSLPAKNSGKNTFNFFFIIP